MKFRNVSLTPEVLKKLENISLPSTNIEINGVRPPNKMSISSSIVRLFTGEVDIEMQNNETVVPDETINEIVKLVSLYCSCKRVIL